MNFRLSRFQIKPLLLNIILILMMSSCQPLLLTYYGIKKPKPLTDREIINYCNKKDINAGNILRPVDSVAFRKAFSANTSIPEIRIFQPDGYQLTYRKAEECNAKAFDITEVLCDTAHTLVQNNDSKLSDHLNYLRKAGSDQIIKTDSSDYVVFIYWARFTGRLNKDHVKVWEENLKKNSCNLKVYKVCMDPAPGSGIVFKTN